MEAIGLSSFRLEFFRESVRSAGMLRTIVPCLTLLLAGVVPTGAPTAVPMVPMSQPATTQAARVLVNKYANFVDRLDQVDTAGAFSAGATTRAVVVSDAPARVTLAASDGKFPRTGVWTGPEVTAAFAFTELLPTFNVATPGGKTGAVLEVRVKIGDDWSPWLFAQTWGRTLTPPGRETKFAGGKMEIDVLELTAPATAYQVRVTLQSFDFDAAVVPSVRRVSVCYSGEVSDPAERARLLPRVDPGTNWARDLGVPFRGQGEGGTPRPLWSEICSPTSVSMLLEHLGTDLPTVSHAEAIYDPHYDLFGNWGRAVSRAGEFGYDAWLENFRNLDQVKARIAEGTPLIASIRFRKGDVEGFLYPSTAGHLIVIRGMTPEGDFIVNDPADRAKGNGVIYKAREMEKAWLYQGGLAYVIGKPRPN